jgi:hypothetical protein
MRMLSIQDKEIFGDLVFMVDSKLYEVMTEIAAGNFGAGQVTLKISVRGREDELEIPRENGDFEIKDFIRPKIDYKVESTLKKTDSSSDYALTDHMAMDVEDGKLRISKVDDGQVSLFD